MKKYTIEQIKEDRIWVNCSATESRKLCKAFGSVGQQLPSGSCNYYRYSHTESCKWDATNFYAPGQLSILFNQVLFPAESSALKKIIGYKSPTDLFNGDVKAGTLFVLFKRNGKPYEHRGYAEDGYESINGFHLLPPELVETWDPIFKEEFKVGSWITILTTGGNDSRHSKHVISYHSIGQTFRILEFDKSHNLCDDIIICEGGYTIRINDVDPHFRLATKNEIKLAQKIYIENYEVKINKSINIVEINGSVYTKDEIFKLTNLLMIHKDQIKSINVGCSGQFKVDLVILHQILNKLN